MRTTVRSSRNAQQSDPVFTYSLVKWSNFENTQQKSTPKIRMSTEITKRPLPGSGETDCSILHLTLTGHFTANTGRFGLMLDQRRRLRATMKPTLAECLVFGLFTSQQNIATRGRFRDPDLRINPISAKYLIQMFTHLKLCFATATYNF